MKELVCYICQARCFGQEALRRHFAEHVKQDEEGTGEDRHKFRLWLKEKQEYASKLDEIFLAHSGRVWLNEPSYEWHDITDKCIIEFCTGLKDKNGKLISEGDILRVGRGPIGTKLRFTVDAVEWCDGGGGGWAFKLVPLQHRGWSCLEDRLEIIGNIHENPELLEVK